MVEGVSACDVSLESWELGFCQTGSTASELLSTFRRKNPCAFDLGMCWRLPGDMKMLWLQRVILKVHMCMHMCCVCIFLHNQYIYIYI